MERLKCPTDIAGVEEQEVVDEGDSQSLFMTMKWGIQQMIGHEPCCWNVQ